MSRPLSDGPRLLRADEQQLERAARGVSGGGAAFVVIVCEPALREQALEVLRRRAVDVEVPSPEDVRQPEEVLAALTRPAERNAVRSLSVVGNPDGVFEALNLHREKLLSGAPVLLWLEGQEALRRLREIAPDAYSFRETVVLVRGDGGALQIPGDHEPEHVAQARQQLQRARTPLQRAAAGRSLAEELGVRRRFAEAEEAARTALRELPPATNEEEQELRVRLFGTLATTATGAGRKSQALYWCRRGLAEIGPMPAARSLPWRARFLAEFPGPFSGADSSKTTEALRLADSSVVTPEVRARALYFACHAARGRGDLRRARALYEELRGIESRDEFNAALSAQSEAKIEEDSGSFALAERRYRDAMAVGPGASEYMRGAVVGLVKCAIAAGELEAAQRRAAEGLERSDEAQIVSRKMRAQIAMARGDADGCLGILRQARTEAMAEQNDGRMLRICEELVDATLSMYDAERLGERDLHGARGELDEMRDAVQAMTGAEGPPWYPIQFLMFRARLLAATPGMLQQAVDSSAQALDDARSRYPDLIPESGRLLGEHLIQAGKVGDALASLAEAEKAAEAGAFLRELVRIRAARVRALVRKDEAPAVVEPHVAALRESFAATESPRITAETLRSLAVELPPLNASVDPLPLAEEAHALFVSMPMPAEEARCLEAMGDILRARGRAAEAKRRYIAARARLERHGLGLRLPVLGRKIEALG